VSEAGVRNGEPYGVIEARSSELKGVEIGPEEVPSVIDEVPILTLAASQAEGRTVITGAGELRHKESDRLGNVVQQLGRLGAGVAETGDGLIIDGPTQLKGAEVHSCGDHRMAMTLAIAGLLAEGETLIGNTDSVAVSFPEFFRTLETLSG
jgi:3-phosphoshikimate 1-carboxyvinyltransferase